MFCKKYDTFPQQKQQQSQSNVCTSLNITDNLFHLFGLLGCKFGKDMVEHKLYWPRELIHCTWDNCL